jgi:hypothetical protein
MYNMDIQFHPFISTYIFDFQESPEEAEKFITSALSNLRTTMNVMEAVQSTDLVVEAVLENINVKHKLFSSIDPVKIFFLYPYIYIRLATYYSVMRSTCKSRQKISLNRRYVQCSVYVCQRKFIVYLHITAVQNDCYYSVIFSKQVKIGKVISVLN